MICGNLVVITSSIFFLLLLAFPLCLRILIQDIDISTPILQNTFPPLSSISLALHNTFWNSSTWPFDAFSLQVHPFCHSTYLLNFVPKYVSLFPFHAPISSFSQGYLSCLFHALMRLETWTLLRPAQASNLSLSLIPTILASSSLWLPASSSGEIILLLHSLSRYLAQRQSRNSVSHEGNKAFHTVTSQASSAFPPVILPSSGHKKHGLVCNQACFRLRTSAAAVAYALPCYSPHEPPRSLPIPSLPSWPCSNGASVGPPQHPA